MAPRKTTEQVVREFEEAWGRGRWDYSEVTYTTALTKVVIICPDHGPFEQLPHNHIRGHMGCEYCAGRKRLTTEEFIQLSRAVHGSRYTYQSTEYVNSQTPVIITCREHGDFTQHPRSHQRGHDGCPRCNGWSMSVSQFKERAPKGKYDYSEVLFRTTKDRVRILCPQHGEFDQVADSHLRGFEGCKGCQSTGSSKGEVEVALFLSSFGEATERNVRGKLDNPQHEMDIYIPSLRLGVEYNGLFYHSEQFKDQNYHLQKYESAQKRGIQLLQIWEDDWLLKRSIVEEHLRQVLGVSTLPKAYARNTTVREIPSGQAREFLNAYHIQGYSGGSHYLGLEHEGSLVAVAVFKRRGPDFELVRYATGSRVLGGHSKLIAHFERNHTYRKLVTFADLTFGKGDLYFKTGWIEDALLKPDYFYVRGNTRHHKFNFRKDRFKNDPSLKYVEGMTERELAQLNGLLRVYDAGKIRFIKPHPDSDIL